MYLKQIDVDYQVNPCSFKTNQLDFLLDQDISLVAFKIMTPVLSCGQ